MIRQEWTAQTAPSKTGEEHKRAGTEPSKQVFHPVSNLIFSDFHNPSQNPTMATFNLGGATFQSGINLPSFGKASGSSGLKIPKVGSVSSNIGIDLSKGVNGLTGDIKLTKDKGNVFRSGATDAETVNDISHQAVCSYFIGPQAENMKFFRKNMDDILNQLEQSRVNYFPEDGVSLHQP